MKPEKITPTPSDVKQTRLFHSLSQTPDLLRDTLIICAGLTGATAMGWGFRAVGIPEANTVVIYIFAVVLISRFTRGYCFGIAASVLATCAFNFFFTVPYYSLSVDDLSYFITFFIMTLTAIIICTMNARIRQIAVLKQEADAERYRSKLLRSISHDLRTPLTGIKGTSEMVRDMTEPEDPRYAMMSGVCDDVDYLQGLIENVLSLTRLQDGQILLHKQPEVAEEIIGSAVERVAKRAETRDIDVKTPEEILFVPMEAHLIEQVLINLLDNAISHTAPTGRITVTLSRDSGFARFTITDDGPGIPAEDLPHIFEMFYTSASRSSDARKGIGLGLAICQAIVERHGGEISARNAGPDTPCSGACFTFILPLEEAKNGEKS
ncbi:MAG: ATP-binding protein [Eubacteriaceae bacterium]|nr:ATP-binding protein [Eubacteriaceae bacterium]MDD4508221.1 ATP-binding protein [Eubacteriaceae bacterium]